MEEAYRPLTTSWEMGPTNQPNAPALTKGEAHEAQRFNCPLSNI